MTHHIQFALKRFAAVFTWEHFSRQNLNPLVLWVFSSKVVSQHFKVGFPQFLHWHLAEPSGLVELFLCLSSSIWNPNSSEQTSQVPPESSMVLQIFLCLSKFGLRVNVLVQYTHWNEQNSPNSKCLSNERSVLNCFLHVIQMNAELPCLVRLCCSKWSFLVKDWGQVGHWKICLEWTLFLCFFNRNFEIKLLGHWSQEYSNSFQILVLAIFQT